MVVTHRWAVSLAVMLGAASSAAAQDSSGARVEITLTEAITRAMDVVPAIVQARGTVRNAAASDRVAWGAFLPSITTSASATRSNSPRRDAQTDEVFPPGYSYSVGLSANMDLFDGLRRVSDKRASGASLNAADAGLVNQRYQVTLSTKQAFYNAVATEELVRVAEAQVRRAQQQLQISVEKLRAGSATRSDSLRSTVDYGNARIALLQARANLATAQANLGRQVGVDGPVRAVPDTGLAPLPDTAALRAQAAVSAPAIEQAEAQAGAARAQVTAARSQYLPTLNVSYSSTRSGLDAPWTGLDGYSDGFNWRFGLSWTLFNGFTRERSQVNASVTRDNAEANAADVRRQVNAQLTQQLAALATNYEQITIARANLAAATEDLRVQQERYRVGAATILDLLTSQAALTQAEVTSVQRRFDYLIARAQVEALIGRAL
jgi:outer membrane protein TolC